MPRTQPYGGHPHNTGPPLVRAGPRCRRMLPSYHPQTYSLLLLLSVSLSHPHPSTACPSPLMLSPEVPRSPGSLAGVPPALLPCCPTPDAGAPLCRRRQQCGNTPNPIVAFPRDQMMDSESLPCVCVCVCAAYKSTASHLSLRNEPHTTASRNLLTPYPQRSSRASPGL